MIQKWARLIEIAIAGERQDSNLQPDRYERRDNDRLR
jgi:hypothetical protein